MLCLCHRGFRVSPGWIKKMKKKHHLIQFSRKKTNILSPVFLEDLGHIEYCCFFKFIARSYLQTAGWVIPRLELWMLQLALINLQSEIRLTFELLQESWPFSSTLISPLWFPDPAALLASVGSPSAHIFPLYGRTSNDCFLNRQVNTFHTHLFILVWKSESLYGGLNCSAVYAAQPVLQLQELL